MGDKRKMFQMIVLALFGGFAILGVVLFATYSNKAQSENVGRVVIWGTIEQEIMNKFLEGVKAQDPGLKSVLYAKIPKKDFNEKVTDALAAGEGPDIIILTNEELLSYKNKIFPVSYKTFDKRQFQDTFIEGAYVFMDPKGIYGIPFAVDPMVMYWNRDIFADKGYVEPPKLWRQVPNMARVITEKDQVNNVLLSAISLGAYENITGAKYILQTLMMQVGAGITLYNYNTGDIISGLGNDYLTSASKALRFFTAFANPVSDVYTWNRSLDNSIDLFAQDKLAMYLGFASDLPVILAKNPNLNFDVALMPQVDKSDNDKKTRVYGRVWAFAITKASTNKNGAYRFIVQMLKPQYANALSEFLGIANVQKSLLVKKPEDPLKVIFRDSAIISFAYLDPKSSVTDSIIQEAISSVVSGQSLIENAISRADARIRKLLDK